MTKLIPLDAAIGALEERRDQYRQDSQTWLQIQMDVQTIRAIPTIDPATIREAALREAAAKCAEHAEAARKKLGASQTREEANAWALIVTRCDLLEEAILALIGEKK